MLCDLLVDELKVENFGLVHLVCVVFCSLGDISNESGVWSDSETLKKVFARRKTSHSFHRELFNVFPSESFEVCFKAPNQRFVC